MRRRFGPILLSFAVLALPPALAVGVEQDGPEPGRLRAAAGRALPLIQESAVKYTRHRPCFSCHHQGLPILAIATARNRGLRVDEDALRQVLKFTEASLRQNRENYREGNGQGGQVGTAGYALLALELGGMDPLRGYPSDAEVTATTSAVAEYLLRRDANQESWRTSANRPPSEKSLFTPTFLAIRGLKTFGTPEQKQRVDARVRKALGWLLATPAKDTEDRAFRLWALKAAGAEETALQAAAKELLATQREDGGWAQIQELASDAYATGSTLYVLNQAAGLSPSEPAYRRGVTFLLKTQKEDGSWYVKSRSTPFQTYFETGFPYGADQFISMTASSWAAAALALACP